LLGSSWGSSTEFSLRAPEFGKLRPSDDGRLKQPVSHHVVDHGISIAPLLGELPNGVFESEKYEDEYRLRVLAMIDEGP
jgi:hypothetical protein